MRKYTNLVLALLFAALVLLLGACAEKPAAEAGDATNAPAAEETAGDEGFSDGFESGDTEKWSNEEEEPDETTGHDGQDDAEDGGEGHDEGRGEGTE